MSTPAFRLMLRHTRFVARPNTFRHASTTTDAAQAASHTAFKSKEAASNITSKASQGLSRVTSSAGPALSGAAQRINGVLSRVGGRTGSLISFGRCEPSNFNSLRHYHKRVIPESPLMIHGDLRAEFHGSEPFHRLAHSASRHCFVELSI